MAKLAKEISVNLIQQSLDLRAGNRPSLDNGRGKFDTNGAIAVSQLNRGLRSCRCAHPRDKDSALTTGRSKMPVRKRAPGSGFQVFLEPARGLLVLELDRNHQLPRPVFRGVTGLAGVVPSQASMDVGGQADVVSLRARETSQDVYVSFRVARHTLRDEISRFFPPSTVRVRAQLRQGQSLMDRSAFAR